MNKIMDLEELLSTQYKLQHRMGFPNGEGEAGVKENLLHVVVEAVEALREVNFKNWKAKKFEVDRDKLATELMDIMQFLANAALAMGLTSDDLTRVLRQKWQVNHARIDEGSVVQQELL